MAVLVVLTPHLAVSDIGDPSAPPPPPSPPLAPGIPSTEQFVRTPPFIDPGWIERIQRVEGVRRFRIVELALPADLPKSVDRMAVNLFPDVRFTVASRRIFVRGLTRFSWFGRIEEDGRGRIGMSYRDGKAVATAVFRGRYFRSISLAPQVFAVLEMDRKPDFRCGVGFDPEEEDAGAHGVDPAPLPPMNPPPSIKEQS